MTERTVFLSALEIADPIQRAVYIDDACHGNPSLRAAVEALLRSHDEAASFLETPIQQKMASPEPGHASTLAEEDASISPDVAGLASTRILEASSADTPDEDQTIAALAFLEPSAKPGHLGRIAHYEVHEVIGQGAFGIVLRAFDEKLHRMVAIKAMTPEMAATSPPRKRFLREARSAAAIRNESIVSIYAVEEQPIPYLVMEYVPGQTLQQRIDQTGPLELREILNLGRQIAEGLAAAHEQGLIHRDIKPSNILLETGATPRAKISDFGLARTADDASLTQSGYIAGTPMYMAPEQARGNAIDARADLFSLGSVLYVMSTGRPPFRASGTLAVLKRVCEDTPRPIQEIIPEIPDWLCRLIGKLHSKTPDERIQTAGEVASLLGRGLARLQNPQARQGRSTSSPPAASNSLRPKKPAPANVSSGASGRVRVAGLLVAASLLAGVWAFLPKATGPTLSDSKVALTEPASAADSKPQTPVAAESPSPPPLAVSPFDAAQGKLHQQAWARYLQVPVEFTNSIGMKFVLIPPGEFMMGSSPQELEKIRSYVEDFFKPWVDVEGGQRYVVVNEPFYLGALEVTRRQFGEFARATRYSSEAAAQGGGFIWDGVSGFKRDPAALWSTIQPTSDDSFPVDFLTTKDISAFCEWMKKEFHGDYVIPNEEQWEYAVRAGSETRYFFGDDDSQLMKYAQITSLHQDHGPKGGLLKPNPFGLFDVYGSLNERVLGTDTKFVGRGGHWSTPTMCRSSHRAGQEDEPRMGQGYRLAIVGDLKKAVEQIAATKAAPSAPSAGTDKIKANAPPMVVAPFSAAQALKHQAAWAKHLGMPVELTNSIGMKLRLIPPGTFRMGSSQAEIDGLVESANSPESALYRDELLRSYRSEGPQRNVVITQPFYLGSTEVRQIDYTHIIGTNPSYFSANGEGKAEVIGEETLQYPVDSVSWDYAAEFCRKLSVREEITPFPDGPAPTEGLNLPGYRLPTEAEWEYACRAGTETRHWTGDSSDNLELASWMAKPSGHRTDKVGARRPNPFGLHDVYGNVWEWVRDSWTSNPQLPAQPNRDLIDPDILDPMSDLKVVKGGDAVSWPGNLRSATRNPQSRLRIANTIGFRVVLSIDSARSLLRSSGAP